MEESKKTPQPQAQRSSECTKCHKQVSPEHGQQKNAGFVCNECLAKSKRNKIIAVCGILACCIAAAIIWFYAAGSDKKTVSGFEGVSEINDSVNVEIDSINVEFNLATATITSAPVSTQAPVSNIEEFKRVVAQNVDAAKSSKTNSISIPVSSVQFGFKSAVLSADAYNMIREIVSLFNQTSKENGIVVEGYACNIGEDAPNDYVSKQRAEAVKAALIENGVDAAKIKTHWYGKSKNSEFNLPKNEDNRRVLISIK
jgi:outer membrane protein OmpA-like peptidoglycan-associated protein